MKKRRVVVTLTAIVAKIWDDPPWVADVGPPRSEDPL